jgi:hypothetical protein
LEADIQTVFELHAAYLSEEDREQISVLSGPEDEYSDDVTKRPQLTSAVKKCIQLVDDLVHYFFEVNHFINKCLKYKHKIEAVLTLFIEVYEDLQKKAKELTITSFCHPGIFQQGTQTSFQ